MKPLNLWETIMGMALEEHIPLRLFVGAKAYRYPEVFLQEFDATSIRIADHNFGFVTFSRSGIDSIEFTLTYRQLLLLQQSAVNIDQPNLLVRELINLIGSWVKLVATNGYPLRGRLLATDNTCCLLCTSSGISTLFPFENVLSVQKI